MSVEELKEALQERSLDTSGDKPLLQQRLMDALGIAGYGGDAEKSENADIRKDIEALMQTTDTTRSGTGFVPYETLLLSEGVRRRVDAQYIGPLTRSNGQPKPGLLLTGPPGTGKTVLAKAIAVESRASFLPITTAEVSSQWKGKSDRTIKVLLQVARERAPCVVFFDEGEKLLRAASGDPGGNDSIANEFKANVAPEVLAIERVVLVVATNHPQLLDRAVYDRLGRLSRMELPPLTLDQSVQLVTAALGVRAPGHALSDEDVTAFAQRLLDEAADGGLRLLKESVGDAANYAVHDREPVGLKHLQEVYELLKENLARERRDAEAPRAASQSSQVMDAHM